MEYASKCGYISALMYDYELQNGNNNKLRFKFLAFKKIVSYNLENSIERKSY